MGIKVENLFYTYTPKSPNPTHALNGVSLTIEQGSFVALVGRTGSGKSTLVQNLNALLIPTKGSVEVDNFIITPKKRKNKNIKQLRKHVGVVFQFPEYQLFEETVEKDVAFGVKNFGAKDKEALEKAHAAIMAVGLDETYFKRSPFELSGGEKRRVAIAGILAIDPDVLVLDEPTAGLDPVGSEAILRLVKSLHEQGKTIIMVTHDMDIVMKYVEKVFVLKSGKLAFQGTPNELFSSYTDDLSIEIPLLYQLAKKLKEKGIPIELENIKNTEDLVLQINVWRKRHE